jgi:site-specific recombinase XerD
MRDNNLLGLWVRRFLLEHLVAERNLARNTQISYRDTLVVLLPYLGKALKTQVDRLSVEDVSPQLIRQFLEHLEKQRGCSGATRNLRLAAIHSLAKFVGAHSPEHVLWSSSVRTIPFKKTSHPAMAYLDKPEMDAVLNAPDRGTPQGERDFALLLFLYNTGARADEAAHIKIGDLSWASCSSVQLTGKGSKTRRCPLWPQTVRVLQALVRGRGSDEHVFLNRLGQPMTRFGIYEMVSRTVTRAGMSTSSLKDKRISPHSIRHTSAVHLLRAGVDINTIRAWLGHVSLDTTHIYAEVDLEMKAKALARCDVPAPASTKRKSRSPDTIRFLRSL